MLSKAYNIIFETLANQNRINILESLMEKDKTVNELTKELKIDQTTISHNLKRLKITGFVKDKKQGKNKVYSVNKEAVDPLMTFVNNHMSCNCQALCNCNEKKISKILKR